jgi:hypothetical protein
MPSKRRCQLRSSPFGPASYSRAQPGSSRCLTERSDTGDIFGWTVIYHPAARGRPGRRKCRRVCTRPKTTSVSTGRAPRPRAQLSRFHRTLGNGSLALCVPQAGKKATAAPTGPSLSQHTGSLMWTFQGFSQLRGNPIGARMFSDTQPQKLSAGMMQDQKSVQQPKRDRRTGRVSRVSPVHTAVRNCTRDEGRTFEIGSQVLVSTLLRKFPKQRIREYFCESRVLFLGIWEFSNFPLVASR